MGEKLRALWRGEKVLVIASGCALATMAFVPPDRAYMGYIDLRVLCLLLCLMAVVAGFQRCGAFQRLSAVLLRRCRSGRALGAVLVMLPFFTSMLVTNDVALLTFVPFTLLLLDRLHCSRSAVPLLVLQTIAANLGSMATPVGNPQNLFLFAAYDLTASAFFPAVLPLTALSLICLLAAALTVLPGRLPDLGLEETALNRGKLGVCCLLFLLCLLTVFRLLPCAVLLAVTAAVLAVMEPTLLRHLDYGLLATFVCFFVVSGNLGRMDGVREVLCQLLERSTLLTAVGASQIISNVPAAVLLSEFTGEWRPLLMGVNIGGLGTPIASLASLITLRLYLARPGARGGRYLAVFTLANAAMLAVLLAAAKLMG